MTTDLTTTTGAAVIVAQQGRLDFNPAAVYLAGLSAGSRRTMRQALDVIAGLVSGGQVDALALDWPALRFQHTAAIRSKLAETYSAATANKALSALRGVLKAAWRLGQMDAETYRRAADLESVSGETLPAGRSLTPGEIAALFAACASDPTAAGARDAALLALLRAGLRREEVSGVGVADFDQAGATVKVHGKRNRDRLVPLAGGALDAVSDWLAVRGDAPGALLLAVNKGGRVLREGISAQAVYSILAKRAAQAGVKDLSPHDWRRSMISDLLDAGADLATVQRLAGHSSPNTTSRYDRRGEAAKARAAGLLHTPYRRPGVWQVNKYDAARAAGRTCVLSNPTV